MNHCLMSFLLVLGYGIIAYARTYDYIIVGSGSAGSVVANRLSKDPSIKVLLLEAGGIPSTVSDVPLLAEVLRVSPISWNYSTVPLKHAGYGLVDRISVVPRAKVLGGGGSMNDNIYTRGNRNDYNRWAAQGATGWDWNGVFPFFLKHEDNGDHYIASNGYHNVGGDQPINFPPFYTRMADVYIEAAERLGYHPGDYNGRNQTVFMLPQGTVKRGVRWSSLKSFIDPIRGRRNIRILLSAHVTKILIDEQKRAYGVIYSHFNKIQNAIANEEVILCAGVFNSAQLLMLSGIGPKYDLEKLDIPVISDLPVGKNLQDHPTTPALIFSTDSYTFRDGTLTKDDFFNFLSFGIGPLTSLLGREALGFINTKYGWFKFPDIEILWKTGPVAQDEESFALRFNAKRSLWRAFEPYAESDVLTCYPILLHPKSIGEMWIESTNPFHAPFIDPNYYSHLDDLKVMVEGMKFCLEMAKQEPMRRWGVTPIPLDIPGCEPYEPFSDEYLSCVAKVAMVSLDHHSGTCKMGDPNDPTTVVDPLLRVKGVRSLRVVDASIMPNIISGHTHAPSVMIGEKGSDLILQDLYHRRETGFK